jgi:hypothetical protein
MRWARCATVVAPDRQPVVVAAATDGVEGVTAGAEHVAGDADAATSGPQALAPGADDPPDPWLLARLQELDRRFVGWLPGFVESHALELARAEEMLARRRWHRPPRTAWPVLPASVVRRAQICRELAPRRIYVEDDVDGLAVLLGGDARVVVAEPDAPWRAWLAAAAAGAGRSDTVTVSESVALDGACDLAVIHAGAPAETCAALARAVAATRPGGHVVVCLRPPWDEAFWRHVAATGLRLRSCHRELDHYLVPPEHVLEGAGDVVVLERPDRVQLVPKAVAAALAVRGQPHVLLDIDGLSSGCLDDGALGRLADLIALTSPRPQAARLTARAGGAGLLRWCQEGGAGLTIELHRDEARLRIIFMPYDDALAHAVVHAALQSLGDAATRLRPPRTARGPGVGHVSTPGGADVSAPAAVHVSTSAAGPARPVAPPSSGLCHLADGLVLVVGGSGGQLVDVSTGLKTRLDDQATSVLEAAAVGAPLAAQLRPWLDRGVLATGEADMDPVLRAGLAALDRPHVQAFARHLDARSADAYAAVLTAHAHRKRLVAAVSQCPVLPETALRRALLVGDACRVGVKRVVCVGDGDLVSVALAALGHEVTVLDIDERLLGLLRRVTASLGLTITVERCDFLEPLPPRRAGAFDVFLTDPVSSRACLEVFVSRAVGLVGPHGRGWVAVSARAQGVFRTMARACGLDVVAWHARHNHYFAPTLRPHAYESDWVEVAKTSVTTVPWPGGARAQAADLYRDGLEREAPVLLSFFDGIEGGEHTRGLFLDMLLDVAEQQGGLAVGERQHVATRDWSLVFAAHREGHLTVHVDRARRQISLCLSPLEQRAADVLHRVITAAHKSQAGAGQVSTGDGICDLRVL